MRDYDDRDPMSQFFLIYFPKSQLLLVVIFHYSTYFPFFITFYDLQTERVRVISDK